jgi:hypothetical protein
MDNDTTVDHSPLTRIDEIIMDLNFRTDMEKVKKKLSDLKA